MSNLLFTVFTPIYNRKHTIDRVWDSLNRQTYRNFEWLIINDGSTDGVEGLLESFKDKADFPVRIFHQENRGKHVAFNRAVAEAKGELLVPADSDDSFIAETLEVFSGNWQKYKDDSVSGISVLCMNEDEEIVGDKYPVEGLSNYSEIAYKHKVQGEKWGCIRTDVMRKYKFPEMAGKFFPESYVWAQIGLAYQTVYLNIPLRKYYQDAGNQLVKDKNPPLETLKIKYVYFLWWVNTILPEVSKFISVKEFVKKFVSVWKFSILLKKSPVEVLRGIKGGWYKLFAIITYIPSYLLYGILKWRPY